MDEQVRVGNSESVAAGTCTVTVNVPPGDWILDKVFFYASGTTGTADGVQGQARFSVFYEGQSNIIADLVPFYPAKPSIALTPDVVVHGGNYVTVLVSYASSTTTKAAMSLWLRRPQDGR